MAAVEDPAERSLAEARYQNGTSDAGVPRGEFLDQDDELIRERRAIQGELRLDVEMGAQHPPDGRLPASVSSRQEDYVLGDEVVPVIVEVEVAVPRSRPASW